MLLVVYRRLMRGLISQEVLGRSGKFVLGLVSTVILSSESGVTHNHVYSIMIVGVVQFTSPLSRSSGKN
jgi:hypothetical protein